MDLICAASHPVAESVGDTVKRIRVADTGLSASSETVRTRTRCASGFGDLFTCAIPTKCTRPLCFPNEHWVDVTSDYYDAYTGHLSG